MHDVDDSSIGTRVWHKADMPDALSDVAFGGKAEKPSCSPEPIGVSDLKEEAPSDLQTSRGVVRALFDRGGPGQLRSRDPASRDATDAIEAIPSSEPSPIGPAIDPTVELAHCFLRLANRSRC